MTEDIFYADDREPRIALVLSERPFLLGTAWHVVGVPLPDQAVAPSRPVADPLDELEVLRAAKRVTELQRRWLAVRGVGPRLASEGFLVAEPLEPPPPPPEPTWWEAARVGLTILGIFAAALAANTCLNWGA